MIKKDTERYILGMFGGIRRELGVVMIKICLYVYEVIK